MNKIDKLAATLKSAGESKKTSAYDTSAKVVRVDGNTAYVNIPGGVAETPASMVVNAKAGEEVRVRVSGGKAYVTGNATSPPTDDSLAQRAENNAIRAQNAADSASKDAKTAKVSADSAVKDAGVAKESADSAVKDAARAYTAAESAQASATAANTAAQEAKTDAATANQAATNALRELSTVENVVDTLEWITAHGTMTLTTDTDIDPTHVYFVIDPNGQYVVGSTHYSIVEDPKQSELNTYYELTIDDAVTNYVATHLVVDTEGLWVVPATNNANRVLIAHGNGSTYTTAGTYIVGNGGAIIGKFTIGDVTVGDTSSGHTTLSSNGMEILNGSTSLASFSSTVRIGQNVNGKSRAEISTGGMQVYNKVNGTDVQIVNLGYGQGKSETGGTANTPYTTLGTRKSNSTIGNYSIAVGNDVEASGASSVAMGSTLTVNGVKHYPTATGVASAVFNAGNSASGKASFAVGETNSATGEATFVAGAENTAAANITFAMGSNLTTDVSGQLVIGRYNAPEKDSVTSRKKAFVIGNGTSSTASNAFTVDWEGNTELALNTSAASGTVDGALYAAITALGWQSTVID